MLQEALMARIPLLAARTTDPLNATKVVQHHTKMPVMPVTITSLISELGGPSGKKQVVYVVFAKDGSKFTEGECIRMYKALQQRQSVLVCLNFARDVPTMFLDVGELPVPIEMVTELLQTWVSERNVPDIAEAVKGLTLKQVAEGAKIVRGGSDRLDVRKLQRYRQQLMGASRGLDPINTDLSETVYLPPPLVRDWLVAESKFFYHEDLSLRARGLIFTGTPGAGKTMAAKYIAGSLGIPLYRFDVANIYGKYVGESEQRFIATLRALDREEPCVVLFDEIEKLFASSHSHETSKNILSELLWWLQEHTTQILTLMTTNKLEAIPPEVWRAGRIDRKVEFGPIDTTTAKELAVKLCKHYKVKLDKEAQHEVLKLVEDEEKRTYASVTTTVKTWLKEKKHLT